MAALDPAAELLAKRLLAVADGEDRNAAVEDRLGRARAAGLRNRGRPAGENDRLRLQPIERLARLGERVDLAIDPGLAHAPRDELGDLGAEIDDEDEVVMHFVPLAESARRRNGAGAYPLRITAASASTNSASRRTATGSARMSSPVKVLPVSDSAAKASGTRRAAMVAKISRRSAWA